MFLLDTEVVWELREAKAGHADARLTSWIAAQPRSAIFISALTLAELAAAARQVERANRTAAAAIRTWIERQVAPAFDGRVLPVDTAVSLRAMALGYADLRDALVASTALAHGFVLATRNTAAFRQGKVRTLDPWRYEPTARDDDADWRDAARGGAWIKNLFVRG